MMLLRQQEQAKHEEARVSMGIEVQNPTPGTQQHRQSELEECLPHYFESRSSNKKKSCMYT